MFKFSCVVLFVHIIDRQSIDSVCINRRRVSREITFISFQAIAILLRILSDVKNRVLYERDIVSLRLKLINSKNRKHIWSGNMVLDLKLSRIENIPWGFRLAGGADYDIPLTVTKVIENLCCFSVFRQFYEFSNESLLINNWNHWNFRLKCIHLISTSEQWSWVENKILICRAIHSNYYLCIKSTVSVRRIFLIYLRSVFVWN